MSKKRQKKQLARRVSPSGTASAPKVDYSRNELTTLLPIYYLIRDVLDGEAAVKGIIGNSTVGIAGSDNGGLPMTITNIVLTRARRYLPQPNAEDKSEANLERYRAYVIRAVFYEVTARTLEGMAGQIFLRDPVVEIPNQLDILKTDADGGGLSLDQSAYRAVRHCIAYGRTGILVDYPVTDGPVTKADVAAGDIRPTFTIYEPWNIINWRIETDDAKRVLTFLVLRENREDEGIDGFQLDSYEQYRVLSIDDDGNHLVEIYRRDKTKFDQTETYTPTDHQGKPLTYIPFMFIGSENNSEVPNRPPLYGMSSVNIAHYRNSADYEEACFIAGQPTPVLTGLTEDWVTNVLKGSITLGSRASIPLPVGANATLIQATANTMPIEAMKHKEDQMVAIGAKLVQTQRQATKTATQKIIETTSESSTLANVAKNVSQAFVWALGVACDFVGAAKTAIKYELNKDFDLTSMTADDQNAVITQWQTGAIAFPEMRTVLRRAGTATLDDKEAQTAIDADIAAGRIPDPSLQATTGQPPKGQSDAGGPQPKRVRSQGSPGSTA